jgi:hypothetical protein
MSVSSCAQTVSRRLPARGVSGTAEKRPIQRRPEMMRLASASEEKLQSSLTRAIRVLDKDYMSVSESKAMMADVRFLGINGAGSLLGGLSPGGSGDEPFLLSGIEPLEGNERLDELGEALVTESATDDGLRLRDIVKLAEGSRVTVGVCNESKGGCDIVWLRVRHELGTGNIDLLVIVIVRSIVKQREQDTARRPGELVSERVVAAVGGRETTAV